MEDLYYRSNDTELGPEVFLDLVNRVWPGQYNLDQTRASLQKTINATAWQGELLVGCVRLLTDGYFFSTITEILVDPAWQRKGIGSRLMELAWKGSPTSLSFGVQPGNEAFFLSLGYAKGLPSYQRLKSRNRPPSS